MLYILAGITGMCALICLCGLLEKLWDKIFPAEPAEKESAPNAATSEGTKIIYLDEIVSRKGGAVK